jgi:hypothetical protein
MMPVGAVLTSGVGEVVIAEELGCCSFDHPTVFGVGLGTSAGDAGGEAAVADPVPRFAVVVAGISMKACRVCDGGGRDREVIAGIALTDQASAAASDHQPQVMIMSDPGQPTWDTLL